MQAEALLNTQKLFLYGFTGVKGKLFVNDGGNK